MRNMVDDDEYDELRDAAREAVWAWDFFSEYAVDENRDLAVRRMTDTMRVLRERLAERGEPPAATNTER